MPTLTHRSLIPDDLEAIGSFIRSPEELFYVSPKFHYPLTPEQILRVLENRYSPTVIVPCSNPEPLAYANLYDKDEESRSCWLGNVIVSPEHRSTGVAACLINAMMNEAKFTHGLQNLKLYCHNTNTRALLFYCKHGFNPCGHKIVFNQKGQKIAAIEMQRSL
ncbi:Mycothiol acetyltransferase [compost metagenome]